MEIGGIKEMTLNVKAIIEYTVNLTQEDVEKIKKKIKDEKIDFVDDEEVCEIISDLYADGEISLHDDWKCTESDFMTESIEISEFEERTIEEILK